MPRLVAWYADVGITYEYSGHTAPQNNWTEALLIIKQHAEYTCQCTFNGALLNLYRNGQDSMSWHSDDEFSLGKKPTIASYSFGATRVFKLKHQHKTLPVSSIELTSGSLLIMRGTTQTHWKHAVPKTKKQVGPRINVTFRNIIS